MSQYFKRTKEDFICEHCTTTVSGDGYTNHCPVCLWSKHVDVYPGDRAEECGGLMRPITLTKQGDSFRVTHRCERCGEERVVKTREGDDVSALLSLP